jgi:hypothetical protein
LLSNFFVAIHDGDIEFYLDNRKVVINQSTMQSYFPRDDVKKAAEDAGMLEQLSWAETCSNALAAGEFKSETVEVPGLGDFEVLIQVGEEMPSKVFFVRNGMYITDTLKHFGKPLKRFPNTKAFAVIVRPKSVDDASSANIKRMENPEHNELTTGYIASPEEVSKLQEAVQHLESEVREVINKYAQMEVLDSREIEELAEFFPAPGEDEYVVYQKDGDPTSVISERVPRKRARIGYRNDGEKGGKGKRGKGSSRSKGGKGPGGDKGGNNKQIHLSCRAMKVSESSWRIRIEEVGGSGTIEFWPQARSRGTETKSLKIESCNLNNANIAADGLSMRVPVSGEKPVELELALNDDDSVVDFRPVLSEK